uniref:Uncharacterized protein n=1 Tax=Aegilops tauschii subsp. strangulata TaxID=200361 RepID=A0A453N645_AEGTS
MIGSHPEFEHIPTARRPEPRRSRSTRNSSKTTPLGRYATPGRCRRGRLTQWVSRDFSQSTAVQDPIWTTAVQIQPEIAARPPAITTGMPRARSKPRIHQHCRQRQPSRRAPSHDRPPRRSPDRGRGTQQAPTTARSGAGAPAAPVPPRPAAPPTRRAPVAARTSTGRHHDRATRPGPRAPRTGTPRASTPVPATPRHRTRRPTAAATAGHSAAAPSSRPHKPSAQIFTGQHPVHKDQQPHPAAMGPEQGQPKHLDCRQP